MSATESHNNANLNRSRADSFADLAAIVARVIGAGQERPQPFVTVTPDFASTPAEVGYGHGV